MWFVFFLACGSSPTEPTSKQIANDTTPMNDAVQQDNTQNANAKTEQVEKMKAAPELPEYKDKELVQVSGTVSYAGNQVGKIKLEVLQNDGQSGAPSLLVQKDLKELGPFEINVPKDKSNLTIMVYIDRNLDQITDDDPRGYHAFATETKNITDLTITIMDEKEMKQVKDEKDIKKSEEKKK